MMSTLHEVLFSLIRLIITLNFHQSVFGVYYAVYIATLYLVTPPLVLLLAITKEDNS